VEEYGKSMYGKCNVTHSHIGRGTFGLNILVTVKAHKNGSLKVNTKCAKV
jgi:hypothetical protein